jgi:hypothetical protein
VRDDRIFPITRIIAALVVPFLVLAWVILYFFPDMSGERFAWRIQPAMTAVYMGAGYIGGAWLFIQVILGRRWHAVAPGFLPVTTFTVAMLLATVLHWTRFDLHHLPFRLWLALYVVTPFLVPWMWWRNRVADPGVPEPGDRIVPPAARRALRGLGWLLAAFAAVGFLRPDLLAAIWVWRLTPLTARVLSGWFALLAAGGIVISRESRWSAWRVGLTSIGLWHALVLIGAVAHAGDFTAGPANWYTASVALVLLGMAALAIRMARPIPV